MDAGHCPCLLFYLSLTWEPLCTCAIYLCLVQATQSQSLAPAVENVVQYSPRYASPKGGELQLHVQVEERGSGSILHCPGNVENRPRWDPSTGALLLFWRKR